MIDSGWRSGGHYAGLIVEVCEDDHFRAGCDQKMPPVGTRVMCVRHAGDCFWLYSEVNKDGSLGPPFGAYVFGKPIGTAKLRVEGVL